MSIKKDKSTYKHENIQIYRNACGKKIMWKYKECMNSI